MSAIQQRREIVGLLRDDLYEVVDAVGDGVRYRSPLGWEVRFGYLPKDPSVTIFRPGGSVVEYRWDETPHITDFMNVLP